MRFTGLKVMSHEETAGNNVAARNPVEYVAATKGVTVLKVVLCHVTQNNFQRNIFKNCR